jgi:hypothetical protein
MGVQDLVARSLTCHLRNDGPSLCDFRLNALVEVPNSQKRDDDVGRDLFGNLGVWRTDPSVAQTCLVLVIGEIFCPESAAIRILAPLDRVPG